jgi:hypothetical protein
VSERHTTYGGRPRVIVAGPPNGRPAGSPYVYQGQRADRAREAEVARRLAIVRALISREAPGITDGPGPEWQSELAAEARDDARALPAPGPTILEPEPAPPQWCDDCGYRTGAPGHQRECGTP